MFLNFLSITDFYCKNYHQKYGKLLYRIAKELELGLYFRFNYTFLSGVIQYEKLQISKITAN